MNTTMNSIDSEVTTDGNGNVFVSVDLPVGIADELIAILRASETPALSAVIGTLWDAAVQGVAADHDFHPQDSDAGTRQPLS